MKMRVCPRCEENAFEKLETYKVCHSCNYNTVEKYNSDQSEDSKNGLRLLEDNKARMWGRAGFDILKVEDRSLKPLFTDTDYAVVRNALQQLPESDQQVIFLRFWKRHDVISIADHLGLQARTVEACLRRAYAKLKGLCLVHPSFGQKLAAQAAVQPLAA